MLYLAKLKLVLYFQYFLTNHFKAKTPGPEDHSNERLIVDALIPRITQSFSALVTKSQLTIVNAECIKYFIVMKRQFILFEWTNIILQLMLPASNETTSNLIREREKNWDWPIFVIVQIPEFFSHLEKFIQTRIS